MLLTAGFKDHFSTHAEAYERYRPTYPAALFDAVRALAPDARVVWDCATGNGQAALGLAERFDQVLATDASAQQIEHAAQRSNVTYSVAPAEASGLADAAVDLVFVGQALHWFDFDAFYAEARRVARPGAPLVAVTYWKMEIDDPAVMAAYLRYRALVEADWPPERAHVEVAYATIPFPFRRLPAPELVIRRAWGVDDVLGYMGTWSSARRYWRRTGVDPRDAVRDELQRAWGDAKTRPVSWPLIILAGQLRGTE